MYGERGLVLRARLSRGRESGQIPIIISFLTRQKFLGVLIGLVTNEARGCLFWHVLARRQGGFEGVRSNPPFGLQKILYTALTVHFKCPTVGKWSTTGTSSLAAVENHRCPSKSGCSYVGLFLEDQH